MKTIKLEKVYFCSFCVEDIRKYNNAFMFTSKSKKVIINHINKMHADKLKAQ